MIGLNTACDVYRATRTENEFGEPESTWEPIVSQVACRFVLGDPARRVELKPAGGGDALQATHLVIFPPGTDVAPGDRLYWEERFYDVLSADDVDATGHHIEAYVVRLEGA